MWGICRGSLLIGLSVWTHQAEEADPPEFWFRYVMRKNFGNRTVTMKQYPILDMFVTLCGLLKKLIYSCMRNDISPILRPLDRWVGRLLVFRHGYRRYVNEGLRFFEHAHPIEPGESFRDGEMEYACAV